MESEFRKELIVLLNKHSMDTAANAPDFILAGYIERMIHALGDFNSAHMNWRGLDQKQKELLR